MLYMLKGCGKCGGDLGISFDEWSCIQCGACYYPKNAVMDLRLEPVDVQQPVAVGGASDGEDRGGKRPKIRQSARHLTQVPAETRFNEEQWWNKNQQVIKHLDQGMKMREIAEIVGRGPRQIRVVRERLRDLRSAVPELAAAD
ncbi:MAG: hypothetical protein CL902_12765 [Dehalococcoidia bacterium]|nr:hypothetical protein [Dehalococcoidia bacterium]